MLKQLLGGAILATALALPAQSPLTTLYAGGNGLGGNTAVYFDLTVNAPLTINQLVVSEDGQWDMTVYDRTLKDSDHMNLSFTRLTNGTIGRQAKLSMTRSKE